MVRYLKTYLRYIKKQLRPKKETLLYLIGNYEIIIPSNHTLPAFQKKHKLYDRFLPILAKCLDEGEIIIDIGANVGDSTVAMLSESNNNILCIEPSDKYFSFLEKNIGNLPESKRKLVRCLKTFVGNNINPGSLKHHGGTAFFDGNSNGQVNFQKLDQICKAEEVNISLIKSDTDGFDYDALLSAKEIISKSMPILYWENQIENLTQKDGFDQLYELLSVNNYTHIYVFDNFGNLMLENIEFKTLSSLNSYIFSMLNISNTRTIYYTDILAFAHKDHFRVTKVIEKYKTEWINQK